jgi:hypothetical protein
VNGSLPTLVAQNPASLSLLETVQESKNNNESLRSVAANPRQWSYQDTILIADIIGRVATAASAGVFLVAPLVILSHLSSRSVQLAVIATCIMSLSFLVSIFLRFPSFEIYGSGCSLCGCAIGVCFERCAGTMTWCSD